MEVTDWMGGKHIGHVQCQESCAQLFIDSRISHPFKGFYMFKVDEYGSLELAKAAAERYRCEISLMLGKTKNQYRYMKDLVTGLEYIEVKLTKRYVTKIDTEDLPKVEARKWRAEVGEKGHVYARSDPR